MTKTDHLPDILIEICRRRAERLREARRAVRVPPMPSVDDAPDLLSTSENAFLQSLAARRGGAVIAEVKMGSPKLGSLAGRFDPEEQARAYARGGAAALSVVVEPDFFFGGYELLKRASQASGLPAIAKDFVVDPLQLVWARDAGASAVLLVAALYTAEELAHYAALARALGVVPLVETHDLSDLHKLGSRPWELVGVNARDLRTFQVELGTAMALLPSLPQAAIKVAESGIHTPSDLAMLRSAGFDAYLIGESLLLADDPEAHLGALLGASRSDES